MDIPDISLAAKKVDLNHIKAPVTIYLSKSFEAIQTPTYIQIQ